MSARRFRTNEAIIFINTSHMVASAPAVTVTLINPVEVHVHIHGQFRGLGSLKCHDYCLENPSKQLTLSQSLPDLDKVVAS